MHTVQLSGFTSPEELGGFVSLHPKHSSVFGLHSVPRDARRWHPMFSRWLPNPQRHRLHRPTQASWATNQHHVEYGSCYERDQQYLTESSCRLNAWLMSSAHLSGRNRGTLPGRSDHGGTQRPTRGCLGSPGLRNRCSCNFSAKGAVTRDVQCQSIPRIPGQECRLVP